MKMYTETELVAMDSKADVAVKAMTVTGVGIGFAPVMIDIAALMAAMGAGVVAIGACYQMKVNKEDAGELIKQFFKAAGLTFSMVFAGQKIVGSLMKSNPATYLPFMITDAIVCGASAYAVGSTSQKYFRRRAQGKTASAAEIKQWMAEGKQQGKGFAKAQADQRAKASQA